LFFPCEIVAPLPNNNDDNNLSTKDSFFHSTNDIDQDQIDDDNNDNNDVNSIQSPYPSSRGTKRSIDMSNVELFDFAASQQRLQPQKQ
jgi:hypothetical protein